MDKDYLFYIEAFEKAVSVKQFQQEFQKFVKAVGFDYFAISELVNPNAIPYSRNFSCYNVPDDWSARWLGKNYGLHDPNTLMALRCQTPWQYKDIYTIAEGKGKRIMNEAREYGVRHGFVVPIHSFDLRPGCVSIGGQVVQDLDLDMMHTYQLICSHAYIKWMNFQYETEKPPRLTEKERDILSLFAAGYSGMGVTEQLHITENTLRTHQKNIRLKLAAGTMAHAVAKALRLKLIMP